ncbi:IS5 family transposase [Metapseudomonas furukawaii]
MKQMIFADVEYAGQRKQTRKEMFLSDIDQTVPWQGLTALIGQHYPNDKGGRVAHPQMALLPVHLLQNCSSYSDLAMAETPYKTTILRQFAGLSLERIPDETTFLNLRCQLETHELATGILATTNGCLGGRDLSLNQGALVDATQISAPNSIKNQDGQHDPEMYQTKKGNQWSFGMQAHVGADVQSGLVHRLVGTTDNLADVTQVDKLLRGEENVMCADIGYTAVEKPPGTSRMPSHPAGRGSSQHLPETGQAQRPVSSPAKDREGQGAGACQGRAPDSSDQVPTRLCEGAFRGLADNTAQLRTLFAFSRLWTARRYLLASAGEMRPCYGPPPGHVPKSGRAWGISPSRPLDRSFYEATGLEDSESRT